MCGKNKHTLFRRGFLFSITVNVSYRNSLHKHRMKKAAVHSCVFCNNKTKLGLWQGIEETNYRYTKSPNLSEHAITQNKLEYPLQVRLFHYANCTRLNAFPVYWKCSKTALSCWHHCQTPSADKTSLPAHYATPLLVVTYSHSGWQLFYMLQNVTQMNVQLEIVQWPT
jgi:hypothetical protein